MLRIKYPTFSGRAPTLLLALGLAAGLAACDFLSTDVENPNVVVQEDIEKPAAASALVSGLLWKTAEAMGAMVAAHSTTSDEAIWRGTFDGVGLLDRGALWENIGRYQSSAYESLTVARWLGDETVQILEGFQADGTLPSLGLLARAQLFSGITFFLAAENFEDFAVSDRREAGNLVDRPTLYATAITKLEQAAATAQQASDTDTEVAALAYQALTHWSRAVFQLLDPEQIPANPLIDDAQANTTAAQVVTRVGPEWEYAFEYDPSTVDNRAGFEINSRREVTFEDHIVQQDATLTRPCWPGNSACPMDGIRLMDPIDNIQDPALRRELWAFIEGFVHPNNVGVSAREMYLILAEAALANGDDAEFTTQINPVRGLEGLTPYDPVTHSALDQQDLLIHMRRVNLFLHLQRRLQDLYRFGIIAPEWVPGEGTPNTLQNVGHVFPISDLECETNPNVPAC